MGMSDTDRQARRERVMVWIDGGNFSPDGRPVKREEVTRNLKLLQAAFAAYDAAVKSDPSAKPERKKVEARTAHVLVLDGSGEILAHETIDNNQRVAKAELADQCTLMAEAVGGSVLLFVEDVSGIELPGMTADSLLALLAPRVTSADLVDDSEEG